MLERRKERKIYKCYQSNTKCLGHLAIGGRGEFAALHPQMGNGRT
jgi:hypothetical protein